MTGYSTFSPPPSTKQSSTEIAVGETSDGKTVYSRTFTGSMPAMTKSGTVYYSSTSISISDISVVNYYGYITYITSGSSCRVWLNWGCMGTDTNYNLKAAKVAYSNNVITLRYDSYSADVPSDYYLVFVYTKNS